jgi:hypothetical protein
MSKLMEGATLAPVIAELTAQIAQDVETGRSYFRQRGNRI